MLQPLIPGQVDRSVAAATTPATRLILALAAVHAARVSQIANLTPAPPVADHREPPPADQRAARSKDRAAGVSRAGSWAAPGRPASPATAVGPRPCPERHRRRKRRPDRHAMVPAQVDPGRPGMREGKRGGSGLVAACCVGPRQHLDEGQGVCVRPRPGMTNLQGDKSYDRDAPLSAGPALPDRPMPDPTWRQRVNFSMASGVTGVKKLTRLPSGSRNSRDRLPQGIVVGSLTKSVTKPVRFW